LLKTSILEWAVDKNGHLRIKGTSSSSELGRLPNPLSCKTLLICPICISMVLIEAPWFLIAAFVETRISLIIFEFSSCLLADSAINLVSDSSRLGLRSGYEEFLLFC
ncbi:hypothetical protein Tco_0113187, partial [Tanacetum coccineum]